MNFNTKCTSKTLLIIAIVFTGLVSKGQVADEPIKVKQPSTVNKAKYQLKSELLSDKTWGYVITEGSKVIFRSSESTVHPNKFTTEIDAISAGEIKIKHLESDK